VLLLNPPPPPPQQPTNVPAIDAVDLPEGKLTPYDTPEDGDWGAVVVELEAEAARWEASLTKDNAVEVTIVYYPWEALAVVNGILFADPTEEEANELARQALYPFEVTDTTYTSYTEARAYYKLTDASVTAALAWECMKPESRADDADNSAALQEAFEQLNEFQSGVEGVKGSGVREELNDLTMLTFKNLQELQIGQYVKSADKDRDGKPYEEDPEMYSVSEYFRQGGNRYEEFTKLYYNKLRGLCRGNPLPGKPPVEDKCKWYCGGESCCGVQCNDGSIYKGAYAELFNYEESGCGVGNTTGTPFTAHKFGTTVKKIEVHVESTPCTDFYWADENTERGTVIPSFLPSCMALIAARVKRSSKYKFSILLSKCHYLVPRIAASM
jgi:hypothetical protein